MYTQSLAKLGVWKYSSMKDPLIIHVELLLDNYSNIGNYCGTVCVSYRTAGVMGGQWGVLLFELSLLGMFRGIRGMLGWGRGEGGKLMVVGT